MKRGLSSRTLVMGELGLLGEFRQIGALGQRISEAGRLGYSRLLVPIHRSETDKAAAAGVAGHMQITTCRTLDDALTTLE